MPTGGLHALRCFLREETRHAHAGVDAAFAAFDLTRRADYGGFLQAHHEALRRLPLTAPPYGLPRLALADLVRLDLDILGVATPDLEGASDVPDFERLGVYYVVAGSQAGLKMLHRHWRSGTDELVLAAGRYLGNDAADRAWRAFLAFVPDVTLDRDRVLAGARLAFETFRAAACRHRPVGAAGLA